MQNHWIGIGVKSLVDQVLRQIYRVVQKVSARLRELAPSIVATWHNLAATFWTSLYNLHLAFCPRNLFPGGLEFCHLVDFLFSCISVWPCPGPSSSTPSSASTGSLGTPSGYSLVPPLDNAPKPRVTFQPLEMHERRIDIRVLWRHFIGPSSARTYHGCWYLRRSHLVYRW